MPEPAALVTLAESIADGSPVDWDAVEAQVSDNDREIVRQLRILADLAVLHRSLPTPAAEALPSPSSVRGNGPAIGTWAHLELIERLGSGTFGDVYRAWDQKLQSEVALKLRRAGQGLAQDTEDLETSRLTREARLLARVRHPNVIVVHGVAVHEGRVGLWMELVRGATLEQLLAQQGSFGAREAALIGIDLCRALAAIHGAGLLHRDLKAQNVMREEGGRIVLMDLGTGREMAASRIHALADLAGTPLYLAPEIIQGGSASARTDVYSLGVLLYHLVTGAYPVNAATLDGLQEAHATGARVRLRDARADLPTSFVAAVDRAIASDPARRQQTAGAFEEELISALNDATPTVAPRRRLITTALFVAIVATLLGFSTVRPYFSARWRRIPPTTVGLSSTNINSIVVLPFLETSGDASAKYLANAVPLQLTTSLAQIGSIKTVPWTFVLELAGKSKSLNDIVAATSADAVIEGSVQIVPPLGANGRRLVRITAHLYNGRTGTLMWSQTYEDDLGQFMSVNARIADEMAQRIRGNLSVRRERQVASGHPINPDAMELYLRASDLLIANSSPDQIKRALDYFMLAAEKDTSFPQAYSGVAECYCVLAGYWGLETQKAFPRVMEAASRALQLDDSLASPWATRAYARYLFAWDWEGAQADFNHALRSRVDTDLTRIWYAEYLTAMGRHRDAITETDALVSATRQSPYVLRQAAWSRFFARDYDGAIDHLQEALRLDPTFAAARTLLGRAYLQKGLYDEGIAELESVVRGPNGTVFGHMLAQAYAMAGLNSRAQRALDEYLSVVPIERDSYYVALVHAALGRSDRALGLLEEAFRRRDPALVNVNVDPRVDSLRSLPRFVALVRQMKFPN